MIKTIKHKKSFSLPIEIIVVVVILLVVAIIVIALFSRQSGDFIAGLKDCRQSGGDCKPASACSSPLNNFKCENKKEVCCSAESALV